MYVHTYLYKMECNTDVPLDIKIGDKFRDLEQFESKLKQTCNSKFVQFYKKDARTIQSAINKKITRYLDPVLKFYSIRWCCIHGGRKFQTRGKGMRKTPTLRKEDLCPAYVQVRIAESGVEFIVVGVNFKHNHMVVQELFKQLPHNRRLPDDVKADVKKLLRMKANKHMIREDLEKNLGQTITLKDLSNLQQVSKSIQNDIQIVSELIKTKFGADCHVLIDENNIFKGLFFSSQEMIESVVAYPEIIFLDATFKLLAIKAPVYIILNVDGNGESDIVAIAILMSEDKESLQWFLQSFKSSLPLETADKIINVMTDKDFTERDILRATFPQIKLNICVFHVLKIFRSEITCEKFKITSNHKTLILELLQKLVYSTSETIFYDLVEQIKKKSVRVYDYLKENWINIKEEWCPYLGDKSKNFMNTTNNRLEGINSKLKAVIDKHSSLEEFINKLVTTRDSLEKEKNARIANHLNKQRLCSNVNDFEYKYLKLLTPFAFEKLKTQFSFQNVVLSVAENGQFYNVQYKSNQLQTTPDSCTCYFQNSMGLPCKHIFAVRQHIKQELFEPALVLERWKMNYFMDNCRFLHQKDVEAPSSSNIDNPLRVDTLTAEIRKKPMTAQEKYRKTFIKAKLMASLASDLCGDKYYNVNTIIDAIIKDLQNGEYGFLENAVSLIAETGNNLSGNTNERNCDVEYIQEDMVGEVMKSMEPESTLNTQDIVQCIGTDFLQNFPEASTELMVENDISIINECDIQPRLNKRINVAQETEPSQSVSEGQETNEMEKEDQGEKSSANDNNDRFNNNQGNTVEYIQEYIVGEVMECTPNTQNFVQCVGTDLLQNFPETSTELVDENDISICISECDIQLGLSKRINVAQETQPSQSVPEGQETNEMQKEDQVEKSNTSDNNDRSNNNQISNELDLHNIKVPICKRRGRPAGSDITVIGIPKRRKKSNKLVPFSKKPTKERLDILFKWILKDVEIVKIRQIEVEDLLSIELIDIRILEINLTILKKFFALDAWQLFKNLKNQLRIIAKWTCNYCKEDVADKDPTICCDFCLHWHHVSCAGTSTIGGGFFMCANCK